MVFDKTGTLTYGEPEVVRVIFLVKEDLFPARLFTAALGLAESRSEHPLGEAIVHFASEVSREAEVPFLKFCFNVHFECMK